MTTSLIAGADVGGTRIKYVISDAEGSVSVQGDVATNPADPVESLASLHRQLVAETARLRGELGGIGLACAGIVDLDTGCLGQSPNLPGWQGCDLRGLVEAAFGATLGVVLANDVNAAAFGEWRMGAGRGCDDMVMIALGTGVGGGIISGGRLVTGGASGAGEIGHMNLDPGGPPCTCGGRGCLESWAGSVAILNRARELSKSGAPGVSDEFHSLVDGGDESLTTRALNDLARRGDQTAVEIFTRAGRRLGQAVAGLISVLDPDVVIVGGGVAQAGDLILAPCKKAVRDLVRMNAREIPLVPAALGPSAAAAGVACLAWRKVTET